MCESANEWSPHIPGCERRNGAPLSTVPYNCSVVPNESVPTRASCEIARQAATTIAVRAAVPIQMDPPSSGSPLPAAGGWQSSAGSGTLSFDADLFTEGSAALRVGGGNYRVVTSTGFRTADWFQVSDTLSVDVFVPGAQPNPNWKGSVDLAISIPAAGLNNAAVGHVELTPLSTGVWHTVDFHLTEAARLAIAGDYPNATVAIAVNTPENAPPLRLDNIRFTGDVADRTVFHRGPSSAGSSTPFLSFESTGDWSSGIAALRRETVLRTGGESALGVASPGYSEVVSRGFTANELPTVTGSLGIDVYIPPAQPNQYWIGDVSLFVTCPYSGINNQYLGLVSLTGRFQGEFNTLIFPSLPLGVRAALQVPGRACSFKVALNVNAGSGEYILDNLAFY